MVKTKRTDPKPERPIDTFPERKSKRGRPRVARYSEVWGRAGNYRYGLSQAWPTLRVPLLNSESREDVIAAFENHAQAYAQEFVPRLASDIFELIKGTGFPQRAKAQVNCKFANVARYMWENACRRECEVTV
jgi:hypothetical protein